MRDYQTDPNDKGFFVEDWKLRDFDFSTENGVMKLDHPKDYPHFKYFVRVGGGWRGFTKKVNANRYYKQD